MSQSNILIAAESVFGIGDAVPAHGGHVGRLAAGFGASLARTIASPA
jgi:hypothetical protein